MIANAVCTYHRVYREHLDSHSYGKYAFLDSERVDLADKTHKALQAQLEARYGPAGSDCEHARRHQTRWPPPCARGEPDAPDQLEIPYLRCAP